VLAHSNPKNRVPIRARLHLFSFRPPETRDTPEQTSCQCLDKPVADPDWVYVSRTSTLRRQRRLFSPPPVNSRKSHEGATLCRCDERAKRGTVNPFVQILIT